MEWDWDQFITRFIAFSVGILIYFFILRPYAHQFGRWLREKLEK